MPGRNSSMDAIFCYAAASGIVTGCSAREEEFMDHYSRDGAQAVPSATPAPGM